MQAANLLHDPSKVSLQVIQLPENHPLSPNPRTVRNPIRLAQRIQGRFGGIALVARWGGRPSRLRMHSSPPAVAAETGALLHTISL
jgi:hypothetical protein